MDNSNRVHSSESDDYDTLWRLINEYRRSSLEEASFSQGEFNNIQSFEDGTVYGYPASFWAGNGQVDDFPPSFYPHAGIRPFQEQPEFTPVVSRRNPSLVAGRKNNTYIAYVATLCSVVCFSMAFGVYKNGTTTIGMGSSILLQPNRFLVEKINVEQPIKNNVGPILYAFKKKPHLDTTSWSQAHWASLQTYSYRGWMYFLNEGSQINITYSAVGSSKLLITIRRGNDGYGHGYGDGYCHASGECLDDDSDSTTTISWNIIQGHGVIQQNILQSGNYYIAVENLNHEVVEVELNISGRTLVYDTREAYYMCNLAKDRCAFQVSFLKENHVVLSTPQYSQETPNGEWKVKLSYGPRWITFYGGTVVINGMMFIIIQLRKSMDLCRVRCSRAHVL